MSDTLGANGPPPGSPPVGPSPQGADSGGLAPPQDSSTPPGQPPVGSSPVSQPTPDLGNQAGAMGLVTVVLKVLERALPMAGSSTPLGKAVMKAIADLGKHTPQGGGSPGVEQNALQDLMLKQKQQAPMLALLRSQQQGGGGGSVGVPPPPPPGGAGASPPPGMT